MQPLPNVAKAYSMLRQEEKQRESPKQSVITPIALNNYRSSYNPTARTNHSNNSNPNNYNNVTAERRGNFRKGLFCAYCKKEGHSKEECYKLLGYPPGHPLHNKYQPPAQRNNTPNRNVRTVNMVTNETLPPMEPEPQQSPLDQCSTSAPSDSEAHVHARMDQLQNQLN